MKRGTSHGDCPFPDLDRLNIAIQEARALRAQYEAKLDEVRELANELPGLKAMRPAAIPESSVPSPSPSSSAKGKARESGPRRFTMTEEHKRRIAEGRKRYFAQKRAATAGGAAGAAPSPSSESPSTVRAAGPDEAMVRRRAADEDIMPINPMRHAVSDNTPTLATVFDSEPEDGEDGDGSGAEAAEREGRQSRRKFRGGPVRRGRRAAGAA